MQERYDALTAAVIVGAAWGVWHYPWLLLGGAGYESTGLGTLIAFPVMMILLSVVFAWLFNATGGVVPVVMVAHATVNATPVIEPAGAAPGWVTVLGGTLMIAIVVLPVAVYGRNDLAPTSPDLDRLGGTHND